MKIKSFRHSSIRSDEEDEEVEEEVITGHSTQTSSLQSAVNYVPSPSRLTAFIFPLDSRLEEPLSFIAIAVVIAIAISRPSDASLLAVA